MFYIYLFFSLFFRWHTICMTCYCSRLNYFADVGTKRFLFYLLWWERHKYHSYIYPSPWRELLLLICISVNTFWDKWQLLTNNNYDNINNVNKKFPITILANKTQYLWKSRKVGMTGYENWSAENCANGMVSTIQINKKNSIMDPMHPLANRSRPPKFYFCSKFISFT